MVDIKLVKKKQELFSWAAFLLLPHWPLQRIFNSYIFVGNNWQETIFFHFQMLEMTNETKSRWIEFDIFPSTRGREQLVARTRLQESNAKEAEPQVWIDSHLIRAHLFIFSSISIYSTLSLNCQKQIVCNEILYTRRPLLSKLSTMIYSTRQI